ncbi:MAG: 3-dehydroquinate synthase [Oscillospiraceae bacterium]|jgi:3-dehydroquinate synthase|nr:3-dehydroquinate synthase [Oscillospiraceae bacterium]
MQTVAVNTQNKSYPVHIGAGLLAQLTTLPGVPTPKTAMLVSDSNVDVLYAGRVMQSLTTAGIRAVKFVFPAGEERKNLGVYGQLLEAMAKARLTRADNIFALGGGVVGDLAGFAAATYLRGIRFVQIPTTLLAAVDSSVGGKTGVNLGAGKNLAGAFWQPDAVICDTDALATLPPKRIADGLAEMLKHGMIADAALFDSLCRADTLGAIAALIPRNVEIKAVVVGEDECERGNRALLNFGHTIAHAIEKHSDYVITHGHAVALGMLAVTRAAERQGLCAPCANILEAALTKHNLPTACPYTVDELLPYVLSDKKRGADEITLVIPQRIGECVLHKMPLDVLPQFFEGCL